MADFSRPGGHSESQAHISNVVQHAVTLARYSRSARRVEVRVDLDPNMPSVPIESDRLLQVFLNLVLNAYDAMEGEGTLRIDGKWTAPMVQVSFVDSGPGVPPALRERIFEPFFTTKPTGRGTGMGLSVSQRIVNAYGGRIALAEAATGGAVFTVTLPVPLTQGRNLLYV
jgi:C4-dicarboxylate-specific signal transduction histidine kinase